MLELDISGTQFPALCILIISIGKGFWDLFLFPSKKKNELSATDRVHHNTIIEKWRKRDSHADTLAFLSITALSAWLLALGFSQDRIGAEQLSDISARLDALEQEAQTKAAPAAVNGNISEKPVKQD